MKFSLWNFKDWYAAHGIDLSYVIADGAAAVSMLASAPEAADGRVGCALVLSGDTLTDCSGFHTVLQYGSDRLLFPVASPVEVWNCGSEMIRRYTDWETAMFDCAAASGSPHPLFDAAQQFFPFPFALLSLGGAVLYRSGDYDLSLSSDSIRTVVQSALKMPQQQAVCRTFPFDRTQSFLLKTIEIGNAPAAVLLACETQQRLQPGHLPLFETIADVFQLYLRFHTQTALTSHPFASWYRRALQQDEDTPLAPPPHMEESTWQAEDFYQIAFCHPCQDAEAVLSELASRLTSAGHCCITTERGLSVLLHCGGSLAAIPPLPSALRDTRFHVGLSLPFRGLLHLRPYYRQSLAAASLALSQQLPLFAVSEHLSGCLLAQCRALPNARSLIHPDILRLAEADADGGEELLRSLYAYYICGGSITRASEMLYIHRNTLRQRLSRIQAVLGHELADPAVYEPYLLSLLLYPAA